MKKFTITIGIPAHNEEQNIKNMLESVLRQKGESFVLEKVLVVLDGCTDNTLKIVKSISKKDRRIEFVSDGKRTGKATRLNQIHRLNKSQLIGTFDADIVLERDCELELMVEEFLRSKKVNVVAARQYPAPSNTLMGKFSNTSFILLQNASMRWRNGNNIHSLQGSASIIRSSFARSFRFPPDTVTDAGYLYLIATKNDRNSFKFKKSTRVIFRAVSTFADWRRLGARTLIYRNESIIKQFGERALKEYSIPRKLIYLSIFIAFLKDPIGVIGSIGMNFFIRLFPYSFKEKKTYMWEITESSKTFIKI